MIGKNLKKNNLTIALNVLDAKKEKKFILSTFQSIDQIVKKNLLF